MVRVEKYTKKWEAGKGYNPLKGDTWNNKSVTLTGYNTKKAWIRFLY